LDAAKNDLGKCDRKIKVECIQDKLRFVFHSKSVGMGRTCGDVNCSASLLSKTIVDTSKMQATGRVGGIILVLGFAR